MDESYAASGCRPYHLGHLGDLFPATTQGHTEEGPTPEGDLQMPSSQPHHCTVAVGTRAPRLRGQNGRAGH